MAKVIKKYCQTDTIRSGVANDFPSGSLAMVKATPVIIVNKRYMSLIDGNVFSPETVGVLLEPDEYFELHQPIEAYPALLQVSSRSVSA